MNGKLASWERPPAGEPARDLPGLILAAVPPVMGAIRGTVRGFAGPERTILQFRVAATLLRGPSTVSELATETGHSAAAVSKVAAAMAGLGLLERKVEPADRRVVRLELTREGRSRAAAMLATVRGEIAARVERLAPEDRRRLAEGLALLGELFARPRPQLERESAA